MWLFKKKPPLEPQAPDVKPSTVDQAFGIFAPLFEDAVSYLDLLGGPEAKQAISMVMKCCASASNPYQDICILLRQINWRPHLVGAVAIATLPQDHEANNELWAAIDSGSWVTPQLAAVAFLRDPMFADHAWERLRSGCRVNTFRSAGVSAVERHISGCPGGSVKRSAKTAASLVRLVGLLPQQPAGLIAQASTPDLVSLVSKDIDSSGSIAEGWLKILKKNLVDLGVATGGDEAF